MHCAKSGLRWICALLALSGPASAAKQQLAGSGPIDRAAAHAGKWCPQNSPNGIGFTPTTSQATLQFIVQHRTLDGASQVPAQLDNVSVVTRAVYDTYKGSVDNCGHCFGTTFRFDLAPPSQIFFVETFDAEADAAAWNLDNGAYWETLGAPLDLSNPCPPLEGPVGALGIGERPGDHRFATTWITLNGLTPGVEYVLSYFLNGRSELSHWVRIWPGGAPDAICAVDEFLAEDAGADDDFGLRVAVEGDVAIVGAAEWDTPTLSNVGAAYVQRRENALWLPEQRLSPTELVAGALFGRAVAVANARIAVGATVQNTSSFGTAGAVYIFEFASGSQEWVQTQRINPPGSASGDLVGTSLAMAGNLLVIGATGDDDMATNAGAVYVYRHNGSSFVFEQKLSGGNSNAADAFGSAVATNGFDRIAVGAPLADPNGNASGRAYSFEYNGFSWDPHAELAPTSVSSAANFGSALSYVSAGLLAVASPRFSGDEGLVEFFDSQDGGALGLLLDPPAGPEAERFGSALSRSGPHLAVGAIGDLAASGAATGQVHLYEWGGTNFGLIDSYAPLDLDTGTLYGSSVALSGPLLLIGAPGDDDAGADAGSVHVEPWGDSDCDFAQPTDFCELWDGLEADLDRNDVPDSCIPVDLPWELVQPQLASAQSGDAFGSAVALQGHRLLAGAPLSGGSGAAALFQLDANSQWARTSLAPPGLAAGDLYGQAVALLDDIALVSCPHALISGLPRGRVHIFEQGSHVGSLQPPLVTQGELGRSIAFVPGLAVLSALDLSSGTSLRSNLALAYSVSGSTFTPLQTFVPDAEQAIDNAGYVVATDGAWIALGAPHHQNGRGEVHLYRKVGAAFSYVGVVVASDGTSLDHFGSAVAVGGGLLIVGAPSAPGAGGTSGGAVYTRPLFADGTIGAETKLLSASPMPHTDGFGSSVALASDRLLVGLSRRWERSRASGAAELFSYTGSSWTYLQPAWSLDGAVEERLGSSAALSGDLLVLGGPRLLGGPGVVRAFGLGPDCNANQMPDALDIASGHSADLDFDSIPDECGVVTAPEAETTLLRRWQVAPNPFNPRTTIELELAAAVQSGCLTIFDASGRRVRELAHRGFSPGTHRLIWDGLDRSGTPVASGSYLLRLDLDGKRSVKKLVLLR